MTKHELTSEERARGGQRRAERIREQRQAARELADEARAQLIERLVAAETEAVSALLELLSSEQDGIRLKAAVSTIELCEQLYETETIMARIEALEDARAETNGAVP